MAKNTSSESTFAKFEAVKSQLADLAAAEVVNAADLAAKDLKLRAELAALSSVMAPLARWREKLDLLAVQKAHVAKKLAYAVTANERFEADLRAFARAEHHPDNWMSSPIDNAVTAKYSERMIGFLNRDLASIDLDAASIDAEIAAFEKLHGVS